jgi:hypothetical protein
MNTRIFFFRTFLRTMRVLKFLIASLAVLSPADAGHIKKLVVGAGLVAAGAMLNSSHRNRKDAKKERADTRKSARARSSDVDEDANHDKELVQM